MMERISPPANGLTGTVWSVSGKGTRLTEILPNIGSFDPTYLAGLTTIVNYITSKGAHAVIDRQYPQ